MKRQRVATALLATAALLAGCALSPSAPPRGVFDLGPTPTAPAAAGPIAWRLADVTAAPTIAGDGIAYRLAFQQAQRLEVYRDSTWAAPPAALLTQRLREQAAAAAPCTPRAPGLITVHLDAFEQVFSSPTQSEVVLRVQATHWPTDGSTAAQQQWRVSRPAPSPDAAGAVRGLAEAVDVWVPQWVVWATGVGCR